MRSQGPTPGPLHLSLRHLLLGILLPLAGCEAMYQPTALDRLFEPERFARPAPAALPVPEPVAPEPPAETVVAMDPLPDPPPVAAGRRPAPREAAAEPAVPAETEEARLRQTLRRSPWLTRFWSELTAAQQTRVERNLRRGGDAEPAGAWDSMGLADRARLVFGPGASQDQPEPVERRDRPSWASRP